LCNYKVNAKPTAAHLTEVNVVTVYSHFRMSIGHGTMAVVGVLNKFLS